MTVVRMLPPRPAAPYVPFLIAAFTSTLTVGALSGALNLWHLHVSSSPVPVDHHRSHAFAQLFGFMLLFTMGVSFHLAPRLFGARPARKGTVRAIAWSGIGGVLLLVVGRLGRLVPGSSLFGLLGAVALLGAVGLWFLFVLRLYRSSVGNVPDSLPHFVLAGAIWWFVAAFAAFLWQLGQTAGGPIAAIPLEPAYAAALFGGTASWLWGVFLRAGACTLRVVRPDAKRQRAGFIAWQTGAVAQFVAAPFLPGPVTAVAAFLSAGAMATMVFYVVRPFRRPEGKIPGEPLMRQAMLGAFFFATVFVALMAWSGVGALGYATPPLVRDAARHAMTLGFAQLLVFGFAGRMVPGFDGVMMRWPRVYDAGIVFVIGGALARLASLAAPAKLALAATGASGFLALAGVSLVATSLLGTLREGAKLRRRLGTEKGTPGMALRVTVN